MAGQNEKSPTYSADRLWAEQLAMGVVTLMAILVFMALYHPKTLSVGAEVFGPNYLPAYKWGSAVGIVLQVIVHELGTLACARFLGLPLRFRFFGFGANCTAILEELPRRPWTDAVMGFAGPVTGSLLAAVLAGVYLVTNDTTDPENLLPPLFLGMACVGFFYNLFTLIPVLDLEGGWIAPAVAPAGWLLGTMAMVLMLTKEFNLVLLCVVSFALPRLLMLISARLRPTDTACSLTQRVVVNVLYFGMVLGLAWLSTHIFGEMGDVVRSTMGD